ncbi:MAG: hypothetical protein O2780_00720 [Proteobacteria bacterium]|nr:hypothetical protein [Pseudomonadota bacterium]
MSTFLPDQGVPETVTLRAVIELHLISGAIVSTFLPDQGVPETVTLRAVIDFT